MLLHVYFDNSFLISRTNVWPKYLVSLKSILMQVLCNLQIQDNPLKQAIILQPHMYLVKKNVKIFHVHYMKNGTEEPKLIKDFEEFLKDLKQIAYYCKINQRKLNPHKRKLEKRWKCVNWKKETHAQKRQWLYLLRWETFEHVLIIDGKGIAPRTCPIKRRIENLFDVSVKMFMVALIQFVIQISPLRLRYLGMGTENKDSTDLQVWVFTE